MPIPIIVVLISHSVLKQTLIYQGLLHVFYIIPLAIHFLMGSLLIAVGCSTLQ